MLSESSRASQVACKRQGKPTDSFTTGSVKINLSSADVIPDTLVAIKRFRKGVHAVLSGSIIFPLLPPPYYPSILNASMCFVCEISKGVTFWNKGNGPNIFAH